MSQRFTHITVTPGSDGVPSTIQQGTRTYIPDSVYAETSEDGELVSVTVAGFLVFNGRITDIEQTIRTQPEWAVALAKGAH